MTPEHIITNHQSNGCRGHYEKWGILIEHEPGRPAPWTIEWAEASSVYSRDVWTIDELVDVLAQVLRRFS